MRPCRLPRLDQFVLDVEQLRRQRGGLDQPSASPQHRAVRGVHPWQLALPSDTAQLLTSRAKVRAAAGRALIPEVAGNSELAGCTAWSVKAQSRISRSPPKRSPWRSRCPAPGRIERLPPCPQIGPQLGKLGQRCKPRRKKTLPVTCLLRRLYYR